MRARFKAPDGTGTVDLPDDASVEDLFAQISSKTGLDRFSLRYGWPLKFLDVSLGHTPAHILGLHGETLTIVPEAKEALQEPSASRAETSKVALSRGLSGPSRLPSDQSSRSQSRPQAPEDVTIAWPEREGTLLLRVMPSDNSCLFTAFGGALPKQLPASDLRTMIADFITAHPDEYDEAILGMPPTKYCRVMQTPNYWGGAIELSIFSSLFDIEVCTYDVKGQNVVRFGEGKETRCILVYSGIHYDRVAFSPSDPPYLSSDLPPELDLTVWQTSDQAVLDKAQLLVGKLHDVDYYTDPDALLLRCEHPGCDWLGAGQKAGYRHGEQTGHRSLSEVDDTTLLRCTATGCDWLGAVIDGKRHEAETGHRSLAYIPDF